MSPPPPATDAESLAAYIATRSEPAFRRLVDRHLPMVRAAARRQVRDPQLADDVAQAVFLLLAQKANAIRRPPMLAGWLLKVTHFTCRDALKRENRRAFHERKAAEMTPTLTSEPEADPRDVAALVPVLDESLAKLRDQDRAAVAMRFFEGRSIPEVAQALAVSEAAAAKRIERAVAKLRTMFHRRGVVLPAFAATTAIATAGQASAVSVGAVESVSASAVAAAGGSTAAVGASVSSLAKGAGKLMMTTTKLKLGAAALAACATVVGAGAVVRHMGTSGGQASGGGPAPSVAPRSLVAISSPPPAVTPAPPPSQQQLQKQQSSEEQRWRDLQQFQERRRQQGTSTPAVSDGITGVVRLAGKPPERKPIDTSSVQGCAHDKPLLDEKVVVGDHGGLANAVVSIKHEEGQDLPGVDTPSKQPAVLDQKGCQYLPHVVAVQVGQPVVARNSDPMLHNVHTQPEKNAPDNIAEPNIDEKGKKLKVPTDAEYYHVKCDVHPWMSAWIAVIDNPFFAVTDKDGHFTLPQGLKDGHYTLHVWHESLGEQDLSLDVTHGNANVEAIFKPE